MQVFNLEYLCRSSGCRSNRDLCKRECTTTTTRSSSAVQQNSVEFTAFETSEWGSREGTGGRGGSGERREESVQELHDTTKEKAKPQDCRDDTIITVCLFHLSPLVFCLFLGRKSAETKPQTPFECNARAGGRGGKLLGIRIEEVGKVARNKLALRLILVETVYARAA